MSSRLFAYWEYAEPYPETPTLITEEEIIKQYRPVVEEMAAKVNRLPVSDAHVLDEFIVHNWAWEVKD